MRSTAEFRITLTSQSDAARNQSIECNEEKSERNNEQYAGSGSSRKFVRTAFWSPLISVH